MIQIKNVTFGYRRGISVFNDFSLEIGEGRVCGLLGNNGAGKSTLLYLVMGLLRPKAGCVEVDGMRSADRKQEMLKDIFLVPEEFELPSMKLSSYVNMLRPFYPNFSNELLEKCLQGFDLTTDVHLGHLSMGQKKKVFVCIALATNTKYLLMDEPTNGLDIASKSQFRKVVIAAMSPEKTILVSTHQVHDVEKLLDYLVIIKDNAVLYNGMLQETDGFV